MKAKHANATLETHKHISEVRGNINLVIKDLIERAHVHDASKLESPEVEIFGEHTEELSKVEYGSDEYTELLEKVKPAIEHHYSKNRHHPEYYNDKEVWEKIEGYEKSYWVSDFGRIKNRKGEILNPPLTPKGYARVSLFKNRKCKNFMVHRLVAKAFCFNGNDKPFVNHIDGNKANNKATNLEWVTASENLEHAYKTGLKEPNVKYIVKCPELNLITEGCLPMEKELKKLGHDKADASLIWACINSHQNTHIDLEFEGYKIEELGDMAFIGEMTLMDLMEMLCDWKAATQRNKNGNIRKSIEINADRYKINAQLRKILENTVRELFPE